MDKKTLKEMRPAIRTLSTNVRQLRLVCDALRTPTNNEADEQFLAAAHVQLQLLIKNMRERLSEIENLVDGVPF